MSQLHMKKTEDLNLNKFFKGHRVVMKHGDVISSHLIARTVFLYYTKLHFDIWKMSDTYYGLSGFMKLLRKLS